MKNFKLTCIICFLSLLMKEKAQAQEVWPNLNKYQDKNKKLGIAGHGENRIVFMGDSITEFWAKICPQYFLQKPYVNRGISGQTTPQMLVHFRADVIDLNPAVVMLLAGINDIAENTGLSTIRYG